MGWKYLNSIFLNILYLSTECITISIKKSTITKEQDHFQNWAAVRLYLTFVLIHSLVMQKNPLILT